MLMKLLKNKLVNCNFRWISWVTSIRVNFDVLKIILSRSIAPSLIKGADTKIKSLGRVCSAELAA